MQSSMLARDLLISFSMNKTSFLLTLCCLALPLCANEQRHYLADLHLSVWKNQQSRFSCELKHVIPRYGNARFYQHSARPLRFEIQSFNRAPQRTNAQLKIHNPNWQHGDPPQDQWQVRMYQGQNPFRLNNSDSLYLIQQLEQGLQPSFHYQGWSSDPQATSVALSTVQFLPALRQFQQCRSQLYPDNFTDLKVSQLHFKNNSDELLNRSKKRLNKIIAYLNVDKKIKKIQIEGHTDGFGSCPYNQDLSEFRSFNVVEYLLDQGMAEQMIEENSFGEKNPISSNRTPAGRAKNRRVTVRLVR